MTNVLLPTTLHYRILTHILKPLTQTKIQKKCKTVLQFLFISPQIKDYEFPFDTTETMMTETSPNVSVVTILDTFEPTSKMLISTWIPSTVLNSCTHTQTIFYGYISSKNVC